MTSGHAPTALTIAGSDSSGGAGVIADTRTFSAFGVWPLCAITAVTAQSPEGIDDVLVIDRAHLAAQINAVVRGVGLDAMKTGMLPTSGAVEVVVDTVTTTPVPLVVDPVMRATSGRALVDDTVAVAIATSLISHAAVVTPNLCEAGVLLGADPPSNRQQMEAAANALVELGAGAALVTGGHLDGDMAADVLVVRQQLPRWFELPRIDSNDTHGTGCVLSAAIAAGLALGVPIDEAVGRAKAFTYEAISNAVVLDTQRRRAANPGVAL